MEEKKTKKMTKADAFDYLKGKKVNCYDGTNNLYCKLVKKMLDCGCDYGGFMCPPTYSISALAVDRKGRIGHVPTEVFDRYINLPFDEISAYDILSIEIVEDTKPDCERNEHVKALQKLIAKSGCIDCIIISKNDIGILKK